MPKYRKHEKSHNSYLKDADDFCADTINRYKKHNVEIASIAQRLHTELHRANNIKVTNIDEKNMRHAAQTDAYSLIETLGEKIAFCSKLDDNKIDVDKLNKWLTRKGDIQSWISSWITSEQHRYKDIK